MAVSKMLKGQLGERLGERSMQGITATAAFVSVLAVITICLFLFVYSGSAIARIGLIPFIAGHRWKPSLELFGILPMLAGSLCVTAGALFLGVPLGILTAVFMARYCPKCVYGFSESCLRLLAGIPSVVYGFFGLTVIVPVIREASGGAGTCILAASIVLAIMILPTIASVSEAAIKAVPQVYFEGAAALGACKERCVFAVELPAARSGIMAAVVLGIGRAIGETMAVVMVAGNQAWMPRGVLKGARTLTTNIALEMGYASGLHRGALIACALVLFVFVLLINLALTLLTRRTEAQQ